MIRKTLLFNLTLGVWQDPKKARSKKQVTTRVYDCENVKIGQILWPFSARIVYRWFNTKHMHCFAVFYVIIKISYFLTQ